MLVTKDGNAVTVLGRVRCPAHEDRIPSLMIGRDAEGRLVLKCMAGCADAAVRAGLACAER